MLGDKPKMTKDLIKEWTIAATRDGRANGTRPTFVLATSIQEGGAWRYEFFPSRSRYFLVNIKGTSIRCLSFVFEPVGVTDPAKIERGRITKPVNNVTMARLDLLFGTAKAIEKDDADDSDDEELFYKYEKDQPAGAILKFVVNKYLERILPGYWPVA